MAEKRRVLLVDDSTTVCTVVEKILRECGFEQIEVVQDGNAALACMKNSEFEIILCDWEMTPMSGVDVLKEVRQDPEVKDTPFILMSAKKEPQWIVAAKKAGADCMITKPFSAATLKDKINQLGKRN
jgi:two-component system, chemotaxis family, chemotaxis protein CheY